MSDIPKSQFHCVIPAHIHGPHVDTANFYNPHTQRVESVFLEFLKYAKKHGLPYSYGNEATGVQQVYYQLEAVQIYVTSHVGNRRPFYYNIPLLRVSPTHDASGQLYVRIPLS
jgi:hypothetical protein